MADSGSDYASEDGYIKYCDRPEWKDVKPVPQDDGPNPVVAISYSDEFRDVYDYFRAVLKSGEKTERVLWLTNDAAQLNPANYTVWQYRRDVLLYLNANLDEELQYILNVILDHPKNYQVWHHRRMIVEWKNDPSKELSFTERVLSLDSKNYHAWQHRQWVISAFNLYDGELDYVDQLLTEDIRNNSAWNQRHFVISRTTGYPADVIQREIKYATEKIKEVDNNESAWNYLRGVLVQTETGNISSEKSVLEFCLELYENGSRSPYLLGFIVDVCEEFIELGTINLTFSSQRALELCDELALEYDKIRVEYWKFMARRIQQRVNEGSSLS